MDTPERKVKKKINKYIETLEKSGVPIYYEARTAGGLVYKKGLPDIWVVFNGRHIEIEIKKPGGERSAMQIKWAEIFQKKGIEYYCIESVDDLKQILFNK